MINNAHLGGRGLDETRLDVGVKILGEEKRIREGRDPAARVVSRLTFWPARNSHRFLRRFEKAGRIRRAKVLVVLATLFGE